MLTPEFHVKITNFGQAKFFNRKELLETFQVGMRPYQAPEILLKRGYTLKSDIFSTGVVLFNMLTNKQPFRQATSDDRWFRKIAKKEHFEFWKLHRRFGNDSSKTKVIYDTQHFMSLGSYCSNCFTGSTTGEK